MFDCYCSYHDCDDTNFAELFQQNDDNGNCCLDVEEYNGLFEIIDIETDVPSPNENGEETNPTTEETETDPNNNPSPNEEEQNNADSEGTDQNSNPSTEDTQENTEN